MSETLVNEAGAVEATGEAVVEAPAAAVVADSNETQAREQGWVSKDEWVESGRNADEWRPAKEFVDRGELYKSIHTTKRELKQTQAALTALQKHHQFIFEKAHQQAIADLRKEKRAAIKNEDFGRLDEVETEIEQLTETHQKERQQLDEVQRAAATAAPMPEFQTFMDRNPWYNADKGLRDEADAIGIIYMNNGGNREQLLQHVEREVKRKFPDKFGTKRAAPSAVTPPNRGGKAKEADMDLDEGQREIMRTFVRQGIMTEAQYRAELKKVK